MQRLPLSEQLSNAIASSTNQEIAIALQQQKAWYYRQKLRRFLEAEARKKYNARKNMVGEYK